MNQAPFTLPASSNPFSDLIQQNGKFRLFTDLPPGRGLQPAPPPPAAPPPAFVQADNPTKSVNSTAPKDLQLSVEQLSPGTAVVKIGREYEIKFNEASSEVRIKNLATGRETRVWGDPHVDWDGDGRDDMVTGDGKFTLVLSDGKTKVSFDTTQWSGDSYLTDHVQIRRGDEMVIVSGIGQKTLGDFKVEQLASGGRARDQASSDGWALFESTKGAGWLNGSGKLVDQTEASQSTYTSNASFKVVSSTFSEIQTEEDKAQATVTSDRIMSMRTLISELIAGSTLDGAQAILGWFNANPPGADRKMDEYQAAGTGSSLSDTLAHLLGTGKNEKNSKEVVDRIKDTFATKTFMSLVPDAIVKERVDQMNFVGALSIAVKRNEFGAANTSVANSLDALLQQITNRIGLTPDVVASLRTPVLSA